MEKLFSGKAWRLPTSNSVVNTAAVAILPGVQSRWPRPIWCFELLSIFHSQVPDKKPRKTWLLFWANFEKDIIILSVLLLNDNDMFGPFLVKI